MEKIKNGISFTILLMLMVSCSGGGGGSDDGGVTLAGSFLDPATCVLPANALAITTSNAENVVSEVVGAIQVAQSFANATSSFIDLNNEFLPSNPAVAACDISGDATITLTGLNPISAGDVLETSFNNCRFADATVNGSLNATYNSITEVNVGEAGDAASVNDWSFIISTISDNLRITDTNVDVAVDGDVAANVAFTAIGANLSSNVTNTSLVFAGSNRECASIDNVNFTSDATNVTTNPSAYTVNVNTAAVFSVSSTAITGTVTAQTMATPFMGMEDLFNNGLGEIDEYFAELDQPASGELVITGDNSSATVRVIALNMVEIDVDENNDGMIEMTIPTTWDAL